MKNKRAFWKLALKVLFALIFLVSGAGFVSVALLVWAAWPFLPKKKAPSAVQPVAAQPTPRQAVDTPGNVDYPFRNIGIAHAADPADYIVFDTETTGFSPRDDKIIELAALKWQGGQVTRFHTLVNPGRRIPQRSIDVHGITDADVAGAPTFAQILPDLDAFLDPALPIVGQNVLFDLRILWWEYHDAGRDLAPRVFVDTYKLAKKAFPGRDSYALASLIRDYQLIPGEQTHRSESDVDATLALYRLCREKLAK